MNELRIFENAEFGAVRTVSIDNEIWFIGMDVAKALKYKNTKDAIAVHVDVEDKRIIQRSKITTLENHLPKDAFPVDFISENIPNRGLTAINESGLYALIMGSKLTSAKKFKRWVTHEVLPSIRKNGYYGQPMTTEEKIKLLAQGNTELVEKVERVDNKVDTVIEDLHNFKENMPLFGADKSKIQQAVKSIGTKALGGKNSNAYKDRSTRSYVYSDIQCELRRQFGVRRYEEIKHSECEKALEIIHGYQPPLRLKQMIDDSNAQQTLQFN